MLSTAQTGLPGRPDRALERAPARGALVWRLWHLPLALAVALKVRRERRMLLRLDERALKDMGFDRGTAHNEGQRSFWDIPTDRLSR